MDIYIIRDGQETGPHSEETARALLKQGDVAANDYAWREGMPKWLPLSEVLAAEPETTSPKEQPSPQPAEKSEPATAKQKALLSYLGIALPADLSRDRAALLVNDAMESPSHAERLSLWNDDRLHLHPDLFATEIQAKKENRANHFLEMCQNVGAEYFSGITKAHCQSLVGFLDVKFPHWDAREATAAQHYFFPAVAEKFPQLVKKQWRGRLHYIDGQKVSPEVVHKSTTSKLRQSATSPLVAIVRGVTLGILILGVLYLGYRTMPRGGTATPPTASPAEPPPLAVQSPPAVQPSSLPPPAPPSPAVIGTVAPQDLPSIEPAQPIAQVEPVPPPPAPAPAVVAPEAPVVSPPPMVAEPTPPTPTAPIPPAAPMVPANPIAADPAPMPVPTGSTAVDTAPMAALPGAEPPVPLPPPPATLPAPAVLPSSPPEPEPTPEPVPVPATPEPALAVPVAKTNLLLTKPVEIQLAYGKVMLPPGTAVKLVSRQGALLKVSYQNSVITVPAGSTDAE